MPRSVTMKLTGHKTEAVYQRYAIVCEADLTEGLKKLAVREESLRGKLKLSHRSATVPALIPRIMPENMAEGARFETTDAPETIGPDLTVSVLSQSVTKARGR